MIQVAFLFQALASRLVISSSILGWFTLLNLQQEATFTSKWNRGNLESGSIKLLVGSAPRDLIVEVIKEFPRFLHFYNSWKINNFHFHLPDPHPFFVFFSFFSSSFGFAFISLPLNLKLIAQQHEQTEGQMALEISNQY